ncbi:MAG: hypothetical protein M1369_04645 [Deinococcus sp.]|nr:hypothetical protein [Deinococcus sp.]MCL5965057.1 hypothetical protein [Deinococcus sp.]
MDGPHFRLIASMDPEMFQERLNRFIQDLGEDNVLVDVKFSTAQQGNQTTYSALVQYKQVENWKEQP